MELKLDISELQAINKAAFDAFVSTGKYALTRTQAYEQFGKTQIDMLINNKLLKNTSELTGKCRFLISDIITAFEVMKKY